MNIVVCMKQVPATSVVEIDNETGALKRDNAETRVNPYDLYALETALKIKEETGATVTVLSMGPLQTESMMRDAYSMGADEAVILSDKKFAGSDVLATAYTLSQGIRHLGPFDLVLCGRQTTDGDTAQIGPALAELLAIPHAAWVQGIEGFSANGVNVTQVFSKSIQCSRVQLPCLLTIEKDSCVPRLPSFLLKRKTKEKEIRVLGFDDLPTPDLSRCGHIGSPTKVEEMFAPPTVEKNVILQGTAEQKTQALVDVLLQHKIIEREDEECLA